MKPNETTDFLRNLLHLRKESTRQIIPGCPSRSTAYRWATDGLHGVVLRTYRFGREVFVHPEWIAEFGARLARAVHGGLDGHLATPSDVEPSVQIPKANQRRVDQLMRDAEEKGL